MKEPDYIFDIKLYGNTSIAEEVFDYWKYAERTVSNVPSYTVIPCDELSEDFNADDYERVTEHYYIITENEELDDNVEGFAFWNKEERFWEGNDERWIYCLIGCSRTKAERLHEKYLPEDPSMFDEAIIIRFADMNTCIDYIKSVTECINGPYSMDENNLENQLPVYHLQGSPFMLGQLGTDGEAASDASKVPGTENYSFCAVYDEDFKIDDVIKTVTMHNMEENCIEKMPYESGIYVASMEGRYGLYDAVTGIWILPAAYDSIEKLKNPAYEGYVKVMENSSHGLIRLMADSRLHKIVSVLVVEADNENITEEDDKIVISKDSKRYTFDETSDSLAELK